jgi:hypothetical protein
MARRWPRPKADWVWAAAILAVLVLDLGGLPRPGGGGDDSFGIGAGGKKAFFTLVRKYFPGTRRHSAALIPRDERGATLLVLGPARYPTAAEAESLSRWVRRGNSLIFAARGGGPDLDIDPFDVQVRKRPEAKGILKVVDEDLARELIAGPDGSVEGLDWEGGAAVQASRPSSEVILEAGGEAQAVRVRAGSGTAVFLSTDRPFTNAALARDDTGLLAFRLVEAARRGGPVIFDEHLNTTGTPKIFGLLFDPLLRPLTLQIILVALVFGWSGSRRFGPALPPEEEPRRSIAQHAEALGNLHLRAGTGSKAVAAYLGFVLAELGIHGGGRDGNAAKRLARRTGFDEKAVTKLLADARAAAGGRKVPAGRAASLVKALARLRRKTDRRRSGNGDRKG